MSKTNDLFFYSLHSMALDFSCKPNYNHHSEAILCLHSLFHDAKQSWTNVEDFLDQPYYLLTPTIQPSDFSNIDNMVYRLGELIRTATTHGTAHVVGVSMGAHIALRLAHTYPDIISSLILSGYHTFSRTTRYFAPGGLYVYSNFCRRVRPPFSLQQSRSFAQIFAIPKHPEKFRKRTLIVVAEKDDRKRDALALRDVLSGWSKVSVKVAEGQYHLWHIFSSRVFAILVSSWPKNKWPEELTMLRDVSGEGISNSSTTAFKEAIADSDSEELWSLSDSV